MPIKSSVGAGPRARPWNMVAKRQGDAGVARTVKFVFLCMILFGTNAQALGEAESEDGEYSIEVIGNASFLGAYLRFPDYPAIYPNRDDGLMTSTLRFIVEGYLGEKFDYEVNFFTGMSRIPMGQLGGSFDTAGTVGSPYRYRYLEWDYLSTDSTGGQLGLDRFKVSYTGDTIAFSAGRMPINYSVTNVFTPNDFFAPFSPTAVNTLYKPGVDALSLGIATGMLSSVDLVGVIGYGDGDAPTWGRSALLVRGATVFWGFEWSLLGGKIAERWITGASLQGELGPFGVRSEGHIGFPDADGNGRIEDRNTNGIEDDIYVRVSSGLDRMFEWQNATIGAEYMYLSDGALYANDYLTRAPSLYPDDLYYMGRHYIGLSASCDIIPILRSGIMGIVNLTDGSGLAATTVSYNLSDESDLIVGAMIPWGKLPASDAASIGGIPVLNSEFGTMPTMIFMETRFYF